MAIRRAYRKGALFLYFGLTVGSVRDLKVYRKALLFCKVMYEISKRLPPDELYIADLLKRSSCSVVANLAEGNTNFYYRKELNHLNTSISKLAENRSALDLLRIQGYINDSVYKSADLRAEEILKMIIGMMQDKNSNYFNIHVIANITNIIY